MKTVLWMYNSSLDAHTSLLYANQLAQLLQARLMLLRSVSAFVALLAATPSAIRGFNQPYREYQNLKISHHVCLYYPL